MSQLYQCKPSEILNIQYEYEAFCFNEACAHIIVQIRDGKEPVFNKKYNSFSDMYKSLRREGVNVR